MWFGGPTTQPRVGGLAGGSISHWWPMVSPVMLMKPGGSVVKNLSANAGDASSIPGSERSPGKGNGRPLHSCLGNPLNRGAWWATVHGVAKSQTRLSNSAAAGYEMKSLWKPKMTAGRAPGLVNSTVEIQRGQHAPWKLLTLALPSALALLISSIWLSLSYVLL